MRIMLILFIAIVIGGCASSDMKKEEQVETAKLIYNKTCTYQGNPEEKLIRCDWLPLYHVFVDTTYKFAASYLPYSLYHVFLVNTKELIMFPSFLAIGGSKYQDNSDIPIKENSFFYEDFYKQMWGKEKNANYINMDQHLKKFTP